MRLVVFDENLIRTSPAGSCLLTVLRGIAGEIPLHVFFNRLELADGPLLQKTRIPLPPGPVALRTILFTLLASFVYCLLKRKEGDLTIGTEGVFPFCDICYAHFCHRIFLKEHRSLIDGRFFRRMSRLLLQHWGTWTERMAFASARIIVVPSRGLERELQAAYPKLVAGKIRVIPNPIDIDVFTKPLDLTATPDECLRLCFCALGNFGHKGLQLAMEALAGLGDAPVHLVVVGGSPGEVREYQTLAEKLGVTHQIQFAGLQNDIRPFLWTADAFLFPSAREVFPLVCLQAAAAGMALIVTPVYGVEEYMEDGVTGWTIQRDAASISAALTRALGNRALVRSMGQAARERIEIYRQDRFLEKWKALLLESTA